MLGAYAWPGNVRELRNLCERLVVLRELDVIEPEMLQRMGLSTAPPNFPSRKSGEVAAENSDSELLTLLSLQKLKQEELAQALGISRTTLWRRRKQSAGDGT